MYQHGDILPDSYFAQELCLQCLKRSDSTDKDSLCPYCVEWFATMTDKDALQEAKRRFGERGHAEVMPSWLVQGLGYAVGVIEQDRFRIRGTGNTWKEAFQCAEAIQSVVEGRRFKFPKPAPASPVGAGSVLKEAV